MKNTLYITLVHYNLIVLDDYLHYLQWACKSGFNACSGLKCCRIYTGVISVFP